MSNFYEKIKQKSLEAAKCNKKEEIASIQDKLISAAKKGLFCLRFSRDYLSEEQVCLAFPNFKTPVQKHFKSMCLDWSDYYPRGKVSPFFGEIQKITLDAQKEQIQNILHNMKMRISQLAGDGLYAATCNSECDFYDFLWKEMVAKELPGFVVDYANRQFSIKWSSE
jgi:hypothetical protein